MWCGNSNPRKRHSQRHFTGLPKTPPRSITADSKPGSTNFTKVPMKAAGTRCWPAFAMSSGSTWPSGSATALLQYGGSACLSSSVRVCWLLSFQASGFGIISVSMPNGSEPASPGWPPNCWIAASMPRRSSRSMPHFITLPRPSAWRQLRSYVAA